MSIVNEYNFRMVKTEILKKAKHRRRQNTCLNGSRANLGATRGAPLLFNCHQTRSCSIEDILLGVDGAHVTLFEHGAWWWMDKITVYN